MPGSEGLITSFEEAIQVGASHGAGVRSSHPVVLAQPLCCPCFRSVPGMTLMRPQPIYLHTTHMTLSMPSHSLLPPPVAGGRRDRVPHRDLAHRTPIPPPLTPAHPTSALLHPPTPPRRWPTRSGSLS